MIWTVDAIFDGGVLRPVHPLPIDDQSRVRVTVQSIPASENSHAGHPAATEEARDQAMKDLLDELARSRFFSTGPYPTLDELYER